MSIPEVIRIDQDQILDHRGFFARQLCRAELESHGLNGSFAQCNNSLTLIQGTVRGFHFQYPPHAETKMVRCIRGSIYDVAVDLRAGSPTFGQYCGYELTAENRSMLVIPKGFGHGFQTLTNNAEVLYFCSTPYSPDFECGVHALDQDLGVRWPLPVSGMSARDQQLSSLRELVPIKW